MYNSYTNYLKEENKILNTFKSNNNYCNILEHVSLEHGNNYLNLILSEFNFIDKSKIVDFCKINDSYGSPRLFYISKEDLQLYCSPTSLRYIYHALTILQYLKKTNCKNIVEVGCGYGGLCLSINYFMEFFNITIDNYNIIDLKEPCNLIKQYLDLHKDNIHTNIILHDSSTYGSNVNNNDLFFISNYCYTEIEQKHNNNYTNILLPKVKNGFLVWQNGGNKGAYPVLDCDTILNKKSVNVIEEKPQTDAGYHIYKNYFVFI